MSRRTAKVNKFVNRKNRRKFIRTILQFIVLIAVGYWIVNALTTIKEYEEGDRASWSNTKQFIAVSYFGVARSATSDHMAKAELGAQLKALKDHGYETISQQDIIDFYEKGAPLPDKALYLAFEDGRNDSALFSTKLLEKYNYKATMLSYASKMGSKQGKFLQPKELLSMTKKGFWELGSNGYRLAYINILDKDERYFPLLTQEEFYNKQDAFYYTHYLMDYIRDVYDIPLETKTEMQERIQFDYDEMERIYTSKLGYVPGTYMIMHADTLYNGMESAVEAVNDPNIRELFNLHFNREGKMLNTAGADRYDLTRVQPAPYWRTNHLLMKLSLDTGEDVSFVLGDEQEAEAWDINGGVAEFQPEEIALTTRPREAARMKLKDLKHADNFSLELTIGGHSSGIQLVKLGTAADGSVKLQLRVENEHVYVEQLYANGEVERLLGVRGKDAALGDIPVELKMVNGQMTVAIDNELVMEQEQIDPAITNWNMELEAYSLQEENRWEDEGDHIYDGVFKAITLSNLDSNGQVTEQVYSNKLQAWDKLVFTIKSTYNSLIDWAIVTF